jgi:Cys-tRNA(Pro)/Cys-tRNA(Cys) deacylase
MGASVHVTEPDRLNAAVTPAVRALEAAGVPFSVHEYEHDADVRGFGQEAADVLGLDPDEVFKTLLVTADGEQAVAIVPVSCHLSLKAVGTTLGRKRVEMCDPAVAQRVTGYVLGGISPFGQRKLLPTVIDETCELHDTIYVSGGRRGLDLGVAPTDLIRVLAATTADVTLRAPRP